MQAQDFSLWKAEEEIQRSLKPSSYLIGRKQASRDLSQQIGL